MKKLMVILMVMSFMVVGCGLKNFFCNITEAEKSLAQTYLDAAQAELATLQAVPSTPEIKAVIAGLQLAIPVLKQVIAGSCDAIAQFPVAQSAVDDNKPMVNAVAMRYGLKLVK